MSWIVNCMWITCPMLKKLRQQQKKDSFLLFAFLKAHVQRSSLWTVPHRRQEEGSGPAQGWGAFCDSHAATDPCGYMISSHYVSTGPVAQNHGSMPANRKLPRDARLSCCCTTGINASPYMGVVRVHMIMCNPFWICNYWVNLGQLSKSCHFNE